MLCSYEIDCDDIADLTTEEGRVFFDARRDGLCLSDCSQQRRAPGVLVRLRPAAFSKNCRHVVPSFAPGSGMEDRGPLGLGSGSPAQGNCIRPERPVAEGPAILAITHSRHPKGRGGLSGLQLTRERSRPANHFGGGVAELLCTYRSSTSDNEARPACLIQTWSLTFELNQTIS